MKTFGFAIVMVALFVVLALISSASFASPFNRPAPAFTIAGQNYPPPAVAAPIAAAPEQAPQARRFQDSHLLPWNCPNGNCRKPREEVNVTVNAPRCDEQYRQPAVSLPSEPVEAPFPYGILVTVVAAVTVLAGVAAFFIRVAGAGS